MRSLVVTVAAFLVACGSGSGSESVSNPPAQTVSSVTVTPSAASIQMSQTQQFGAMAMDITGNPIPGVIFTWVSSDQSLATISNSGLARGVSVGSPTITATSGTVTSSQATLTVTTASTGPRGYSTTFPSAENPISESGNWINGGTTGVSWTNMRSAQGLAFGTQPGNAIGNAVFADSTATLTGTWGQNQMAQAVVVNNATGGSGVFEEIELRLNTTITAGSITGYECNFSVVASNPYAQIVRWNGGLNQWTQIAGNSLANAPATGAVVKCINVNGNITSYINDVVATSTSIPDTTYTGGSPGIGMFLQGIGANSDYGFSSFTASDGP